MATPRDINIVKQNLQTMIDKGAPEEDVDAYMAEEGYTPETFKQAMSGGDKPSFSIGKTISNIPASGVNMAKGLYNIVRHPLDTGNALSDLASSGMSSAINKFGSPDLKRDYKGNLQEDATMFNAVVDEYKKNYGSWSGFGQYLQNDPLAPVSDIATVLVPGGNALKGSKLAGQAGMLGKTAKTVGTIMANSDPVAGALSVAGKTAVGVGNTMRKTSTPFKAMYNPAAEAAAKATGVNLPASAFTKSKTAQTIEAMATRSLFGSKLEGKLKTASEAINKLGDDLLGSVTSSGNDKLISETLQTKLDDFYKVKDDLYKKIDIEGMDDLKFKNVEDASGKLMRNPKLSELNSYLDTMIEEGSRSVQGKPEYLAKLKLIKKELDSGKLSARDVYASIKTFNKQLSSASDPIVSGNRAIFGKIRSQLEDVLDEKLLKERPEIAKQLTEANDYYKNGLDKMNTAFGTKIKHYTETGEFDKITKAIVNADTSIYQINDIYELLGPKVKSDIQNHVLTNILKDSKGVKEVFSGTDLAKQMDRFGNDKLKTIFSDKPEVVKALNDLKNVSLAFKNGQVVLNGSQTGFLNNLNTIKAGVYGTGGYVIGPGALAVALFGEYLGPKFINSKMGQNWLTKGVGKGMPSGAVKASGYLAQKASRSIAGKTAVIPAMNSIYRNQQFYGGQNYTPQKQDYADAAKSIGSMVKDD